MKKHEKDKINYSIEQCINSFHSWDKKSSCVFNILEQMSGLKKCKWELFELSDYVRENLEENLKIRLCEELNSLFGEIVILESRLKELEHSRSSLQALCSAVAGCNYERSLEGFSIVNNVCCCLRLIIGMKQVPMRRIEVEDMESFQFLTNSNESAKDVIKQFEEKVEIWEEFAVDV